MWRIVHAHRNLSMVVPIVHQHGIFPFEGKRQTPVAADIHRPMPFEIAAQGMQPPPVRVHVLLGFGVVQRGQLQSQFVSMMRLDFRLGSCFEELLDTFVPEAPDHATMRLLLKFCLAGEKPGAVGPQGSPIEA